MHLDGPTATEADTSGWLDLATGADTSGWLDLATRADMWDGTT